MNRVYVTLGCALALVASTIPAVAADDAAALLAKHAAYMGWRAGDGTVKTLRATGEATRDGKRTARLRLLRYGIASRDTYSDSRGLEYDDGFTGNVFWTTSANGFTVRPVGESARYRIAEEAVFSELVPSATSTVVRHEVVDGVDTAVVRLDIKVAFPIDLYVDPATGAYKRAVLNPGGKYERYINGLTYTEVKGKRFLSGWHYGNSRSLYRYDAFELNPEIEPDALRPPAQTARWDFGEGTVPVELTKETFPRIYVNLAMNGVKGKFILDTGAGSTVVTDSFARRAGAKRFAQGRAGGIGGSVAANLFRIDSLSVGPSTLKDVIITSALAEDTFGSSGEGVVGLIGFDLFGGAVVELNLDAGTLRVMDPHKVQPDEKSGIVVRPDLSDFHIRVPMLLNEKYDVMATLDSGNPLNVLFSSDLIHKQNMPFLVDPHDLGSTRYGGGIGGSEIEHCGKLSSLKLGPINYRPVPACDSPSFSTNEILVGLDFMKAFNYVFDYPEDMVLMTPRKNP